MKVKPEFAHLVVGSKMGAGCQGPTDLARLRATVDRVLVLDHDLSYYAVPLGERAFVRLMHDPHGGWKDPIAHANAVVGVVVQAHDYGVRDFISGNEQIGLEGLGDAPEDYEFLNWWGVTHLAELRRLLAEYHIEGVRFWGPALSPGHNEDDSFRGYTLLADYLRALDGVAIHNYWGPTWGFFDDPDFQWWAGRIERAHALIEGELGIVKPWVISEFNRKVDRADPADIARYAEECQHYYAWLNSLDYVTAGFTFLYCCQDEGFADLTWDRMPGMVEAMQQFDRQSEGEWATTPVPIPEPVPLPEPEPEPEEEPMPEQQPTILQSLDSLWGVSVELDRKAAELTDEANRIRAYVVTIKQAVGLDDPLLPTP